MRLAWLLLVAALLPVQVTAQSTFLLEGIGQREGPNARAAQRPLGPNGQAAQRPPRANAPAATSRAPAESNYPSCAAARAQRSTPVREGEPAYSRHLDRDGDGVACE